MKKLDTNSLLRQARIRQPTNRGRNKGGHCLAVAKQSFSNLWNPGRGVRS